MNKNTIKQINRIKVLLESEKTLSTIIEPVPVPTGFKSNFGEKRQYEIHPGTDIPVISGTQVKSPMSGIVKVADINHNNLCGGTIDIDHQNGYWTRFCHMKRIDVNKGDVVNQGEVVGLSGGNANDIGAGNSKGSHLHWTLKKDGKLVDPIDHLNKEVEMSSEGEDEDKKLLDKILNSDFKGKKIKDIIGSEEPSMSFTEFFQKFFEIFSKIK